MFTMTQKARAVVRRVTAHPRLGEESGLRIASQDKDTDALGVGITAGPRRGDQVVEDAGARVYLDEEAVPRVRGRLIDAMTDDSGRVQFVVRRAG
jgi:Fe-S cluster assembly iron-binding protein IscA